MRATTLNMMKGCVMIEGRVTYKGGTARTIDDAKMWFYRHHNSIYAIAIHPRAQGKAAVHANTTKGMDMQCAWHSMASAERYIRKHFAQSIITVHPTIERTPYYNHDAECAKVSREHGR